MIVPLKTAAKANEPHPQHLEALRNLAFVRETMENAGAFTTVPGKGMIGIGVSAVCASAISVNITIPEIWMLVWTVEALIALSIGLAFICHKNNSLGLSMLHGIGRRFMINLALPIVAAVPVSFILWKHGLTAYMPSVWLLMYGTSIITAGSYSLLLVLMMGGCFFLLGCFGIFIAYIPKDLLMFLGFGMLHLLFGVLVILKQKKHTDSPL